jgi:glycosyltransferase involved in cell wall biosynthesis
VRLAWFSPWPPDRSGVAGRSAELVPALAAAGHGIDVCVRESTQARRHGDEAPAAGQVRVQSAHDFIWRAERGQYDLTIYQLGNSHLHEFIWPYLFRWPGLAVLHDARLHHARAAACLQVHGAKENVGPYRAQFSWNHPDADPAAAELAVAGFDGAYYYMWPMIRDVLAISRATAVHARGAAADLAEQFPDDPIEYLTLGEGRDAMLSADARDVARASLGFRPDTIAFGVFGGLTAEKRVPQIIRAFRVCVAASHAARLLLAGRPHPSIDWRSLARAAGVEHAVVVRENLDDDGFDAAVAAVDISVNLRWPTALETSGPWLRALAAGRATVVTDLAHQAHVPSLDPRSWQSVRADPVTIAVDILDEAHSLGLAFSRLAADEPLRARLGRSAREYWERTHSFGGMRDEYLSLIERTIGNGHQPRRVRPAVPPPVLEYDPMSHARALTAGFGTLSCELF